MNPGHRRLRFNSSGGFLNMTSRIIHVNVCPPELDDSMITTTVNFRSVLPLDTPSSHQRRPLVPVAGPNTSTARRQSHQCQTVTAF